MYSTDLKGLGAYVICFAEKLPHTKLFRISAQEGYLQIEIDSGVIFPVICHKQAVSDGFLKK